jgi:hypothetical protein
MCWEAELPKCARIGIEQVVDDEDASSSGGRDPGVFLGMHDDEDPGKTALE